MLLNKRISIKYFLKEIRYEIIAITLFAVLVGWLDNYKLLTNITIPLTVSAILGTAVSLLLAFRTAQSYDRWWEARIVWGAIVNDNRTLIREVQLFVQNKPEEIERFTMRQIIWNYALGESLRKQPFSQMVQEYLDEHHVKADNIPNALLDLHTEQFKDWRSRDWVNDFQLVQLDSTVARLTDSMGKCERIKNTVFPRSYNVLLHFIIYVFAFIFPFGLDDAHILPEIAITIAIPLIFIAIERTAIIMQDPFENSPVDTPMTALATTLEINLKQMIGRADLPVKEETDSYYIM